MSLLPEEKKVELDLYRGQLTPWQQKVIDCFQKYAYFLLAVGRKGRKTTFMVNELVGAAMSDPRGLVYPFIGPTRIQAKEIIWEDHVENIVRLCDQYEIEYYKNNSDLSIRFKDRGKFVIDGGDNIESLRGKSDWGGVAIDEFASWRRKRYSWEEVIEPNLLVYNAPAMIASTPKGFEYFHYLMKMGDQEGLIEGEGFSEDGKPAKINSLYRSFRFTSYDNPFIDRAWIEAKKLTLSEVAFNQEYLARFEKFTGIIYKEFSRGLHIVDPFDVPRTWQWYRAMDFGAVNATACLWIAVDNQGRIYVTNEYYNSGQTTEFHAKVIQEKTGTLPIVATFGDPSAKQEVLDYAQYKVFITPAARFMPGNQDWVNHGIDKVKSLLKPVSGNPRLFIFKNCANLIREFEGYHWKESLAGEIRKDIPEKVDDHALDAFRYFAVSFQDEAEIWDKPKIVIPRNRFTGYSSA